MFVIYIIFCLIAMAFVSNPSSSEDNESSTGTDLSIINTDDEKHIDTTNRTPAKWKMFKFKFKFLVYSVLEPAVGYLTTLHFNSQQGTHPTLV